MSAVSNQVCCCGSYEQLFLIHCAGPIIIAAAGFALLFAIGYWYAISRKDDEEKNEDTDESDSDDEYTYRATRHYYH